MSGDDRGGGDAGARSRRGRSSSGVRIGNDQPNTLRGTFGDNKGQDTLLGLGAGDLLVGRSAADQLSDG